MDRRIPPEPVIPVPTIRPDNVELKVKQGIHKDAFDSALQRADHRRTMDSRDRVVSAGVKQSQVAQSQNAESVRLPEHRAESGEFAKPKALSKSDLSDQSELKQTDPAAEFGHAQLSLKDLTERSTELNSASGPTRKLGDEATAMLFKKLNSNQIKLGESLALELVDDPSGVIEIKLSKNMNNSWAINLVLSPEETPQDANENELSQSLMSQLQQSGFMIDSVSVDSHVNEHLRA